MPNTHHARRDCVADRNLSKDVGMVWRIYSQLVFMMACWSVIWSICRGKHTLSRKGDRIKKQKRLMVWVGCFIVVIMVTVYEIKENTFYTLLG